MKLHMKFFTLLMASAAWMTPAWGQTVYKCGNAYSQQPCPGATIVDASDARTPTQRAHAEAATTSTDAMAAKLEKARLAGEKVVASKSHKNQAHPVTGAKAAASAVAHKSTARKKKEPEYFTAIASVAKKEEKAQKKPTDKSRVAEAVKFAKAAGDDQSVKP